MRIYVLGLAILLVSATAAADDDLYAGERLFRPPVEWSTWLRGAFGGESVPANEAARTTAPADNVVTQRTWDLGVGAEASLSLSPRGNTRLGAWTELRGLSRDDAFVGGELVLTRVPKRVDMFLYDGHGILALRAGRSSTQATAALAYGYVAPFWLEGECKVRFFEIRTGVCSPRDPRTARYMAGVRVVATVTRTIDDPRMWSATIGLEFEPLGALRMLLIARSWY